VRRTRAIDFSPEQVNFLTYGRGMDTARMRRMFGFEPRYTTSETFDDFVSSRHLNRRLPPARLEALERRVLSVVGAGRRA
jgi:UDP-glucose 4-epimerase